MRFLFTLILTSLLYFSALAQPPSAVDINLTGLELGDIPFIEPKFTEDRKSGELSHPSGSKFTAQAEVNSLSTEALLQRKEVSGTPQYRLALGSISFKLINAPKGSRPVISFAIKVGDSTYYAALDRLTLGSVQMLILRLPEEIRIPIDRANTAIIKFEDKIFFNEDGTFPIEGNLSIESTMTRRKTLRR